MPKSSEMINKMLGCASNIRKDSDTSAKRAKRKNTLIFIIGSGVYFTKYSQKRHELEILVFNLPGCLLAGSSIDYGIK